MTRNKVSPLPPPMRIGDAERGEAAAALQKHFIAGRLDADEFDVRMGEALSAKFANQIDKLFADLPELPVDTADERKRPEKGVVLAVVGMMITGLALGIGSGFMYHHSSPNEMQMTQQQPLPSFDNNGFGADPHLKNPVSLLCDITDGTGQWITEMPGFAPSTSTYQIPFGDYWYTVSKHQAKKLIEEKWC